MSMSYSPRRQQRHRLIVMHPTQASGLIQGYMYEFKYQKSHSRNFYQVLSYQ